MARSEYLESPTYVIQKACIQQGRVKETGNATQGGTGKGACHGQTVPKHTAVLSYLLT